MITGAAADEVQLAGRAHFFKDGGDIGGTVQQVEEFTRHLGLFVDLLEHEVGVAALLDGIHRLGNLFGAARDQAAVLDRAQFNAVGPEGDNLAVLDADDPAGEGEDGGQVRGEAGEVVPDANHQTRAFLDGVKLVVIDAPDDEGIIALQVTISQADGVDEIVAFIDVAFDGVDAGLAVVLGADGETLGDELLAQLDVVDHVAVVRPDHVAIRIEMGLGIDLGGFAEGGPAQLGDAAATGHLGEIIFGGDILDAAGILAQIDFSAVEGGGADRVVAAVGEAAGGVDEDGAERLFVFGDYAENSTHNEELLLKGMATEAKFIIFMEGKQNCRMQPFTNRDDIPNPSKYGS